MNWAPITLAAILLAMSSSRRTSPDVVDPKVRARRDINRALIKIEARRQGVPEDIALAFARVESNFDENAIGDRNWHRDKARYTRVVPHDSPFFARPELWASYGLFQLLAPYHVRANEDPRVLLEPRTNAERGIETIKRLLVRYAGNAGKARLAYTGAIAASAEKQNEVLRRFERALRDERAELARGGLS